MKNITQIAIVALLVDAVLLPASIFQAALDLNLFDRIEIYAISLFISYQFLVIILAITSFLYELKTISETLDNIKNK